ncbi:dTDP-4-dehydrorhamnose reductase [Nonomuraea endophytica]|uniref:dTDP-4-dehydrorhamnose reductase n=1 Tax=Nonomuraea endophytica TaxID=714136 RepID=A0A7W8A2W2_9ACTN|nr:dTDP-4-dehydrorhamnose reductase [Nonomuraea endophytica]MBB5077974.1 dTDP-4-dehydrorhamnose reductase [Nonomuraea endophytica]
MRIYLTGADGMLGTALRAELAADPLTEGWGVRGVSVADFDIGDPGAVRASVEDFAPDVVIHTAAHAIVDECEADPQLALRVNVAGVRNVADACRRTGSRLVYVSSDYVFDGADTPDGGYRETDTPGPLSVYGLSKLAGERIAATVDDHLVIRTSWLFGGSDERTDNVLAMIRQTERGERVRLIHDQFSCPTYTVDLARAMVLLLKRGTAGTLHVANTGSASWFDVARVALGREGRAAEPVALDDCGFLGRRPRNSTLSTGRLKHLGITMPDWSDAVSRYRTHLSAGNGRT